MFVCVSHWECDVFKMLNEEEDFEIKTSKTTNQTKRHKRRHLEQKKKQPVAVFTSTCCGVLSSTVWLTEHHQQVTHQSDLRGFVWAVTSSSVPPTTTPAPLRHHDRLCHMTRREPEVDHTMLLVLSISFRDNKRQQKGFQRKYSSISLYPLDLGYWFKYETCTPQEKWQTSTSLSFFL